MKVLFISQPGCWCIVSTVLPLLPCTATTHHNNHTITQPYHNHHTIFPQSSHSLTCFYTLVDPRLAGWPLAGWLLLCASVLCLLGLLLPGLYSSAVLPVSCVRHSHHQLIPTTTHTRPAFTTIFPNYLRLAVVRTWGLVSRHAFPIRVH